MYGQGYVIVYFTPCSSIFEILQKNNLFVCIHVCVHDEKKRLMFSSHGMARVLPKPLRSLSTFSSKMDD